MKRRRHDGTGREERGDRSFADRLDHLFRTMVKPDGNQYSYREVAESVSREHEPISHTYVGQLRSGARDNPTIKHMRGLAAFFGVPVTYFTTNYVASQIDKQLQLVAALNDLRDNRGMRSLVIRSRGLSPRGLQSLIDIVDHIRDIEGLQRVVDDQPAPDEADGEHLDDG